MYIRFALYKISVTYGFFQDFWNKKKENSKFKINNKMKIIPSSDLQTPFWRTSDRPAWESIEINPGEY